MNYDPRFDETWKAEFPECSIEMERFKKVAYGFWCAGFDAAEIEYTRPRSLMRPAARVEVPKRPGEPPPLPNKPAGMA